MVFHNTAGEAIQLMHNGVKVIADAYYGQFNSEIVKKLRGHHEPQQERVFHELLKLVTAGSVMIELGAYWSYYSLWFHQSIPNAINYVVEPITEHLELGKRNFALNDFQAHFVHALVGDTQSGESEPPTITVDEFVKKEGLTKVEVLHADIQGHEYAMLLGTKDSLQSKLLRYCVSYLDPNGVQNSLPNVFDATLCREASRVFAEMPGGDFVMSLIVRFAGGPGQSR